MSFNLYEMSIGDLVTLQAKCMQYSKSEIGEGTSKYYSDCAEKIDFILKGRIRELFPVPSSRTKNNDNFL